MFQTPQNMPVLLNGDIKHHRTAMKKRIMGREHPQKSDLYLAVRNPNFIATY